MINVVQTDAATVVIGRFTKEPITSCRRVNNTNGTNANGMPNDSTTCDNTSVSVAGSCSASTVSAGSIVTPRRTNTGTLRWMNPCITTCPAYVPTLEDDSPDASSATANANAAPPP